MLSLRTQDRFFSTFPQQKLQATEVGLGKMKRSPYLDKHTYCMTLVDFAK